MKDEQSASEAILRLFEEHADGLYRYISYSLPSQYDAKDVVQEVFLRAFEAWGGFRRQSSEKTWLYTIARNYVYDLLRKKRTETEFIARYRREIQSTTMLGSTMEYEELLHQLQEPYGQVILLRAVEGLSVAQTAEVLDMSEANVRLVYFRAKKKFAKLLDEAWSAPYSSEGGFHS